MCKLYSQKVWICGWKQRSEPSEVDQPQAGDKVDIDVIDAGGQPASVIKGGSVYDHEMSFAFIRGGHIDAAVLGTLQVDQEGNIANWTIPGKMVPGMGCAMDLCAGVKRSS